TSITILNTATPALGASTDITATLARFQASTNTSTKVYVPTAQLAAYQALYPSSTYTKITFVAGSSTFQTAGNWSTASNWSDGIPDAGADAVIAAACTIDGAATAKNVTVNADASLTLGSGKSLSAKNLTLKSNASGNATLLNNGTITVSATTSVEQYLTSGRNWYISSPVSSGAMPTAGYAWNEASGAWATVGTGVAMTPGKGYIVPPAANGTVTFSGSLNNNITSATTLNRTTGATKEGFNLVGNPYPSYLNWNSITKTNLSTTMWYRTKEGSAYKFYTYNGTDAGYDDGVGVPAGVTNLIPPMQAFWVRVESGNATGTIGFENAARTHKDIAGNILKAPAATNRQIIRLTVSNGENTDETLIYTNSNATSGIDKYDSPKMMNATAEVPDLYTIVGTEKLVINGLNTLPLDTPIPLGLAPGKAGAFSISANELTNIDSNTTTVILRDAQENVNFDLSTGQAYAFATDGTATENRFSLILRTKNGTTGIDLHPQNQGIKVYVNENNLLHVQLADEVEPNTLIQMYNVAGQQLYTIKPLTSAYTLSSRLQSGVYMVKIQHAGSIFTYKLVVK
ncbi:MAG: hypothetical protein H6Q20_1067, partial [Bacteroidetes bacterium]|nr:hypothetical protein [Bacteroidota bacterium]